MRQRRPGQTSRTPAARLGPRNPAKPGKLARAEDLQRGNGALEATRPRDHRTPRISPVVRFSVVKPIETSFAAFPRSLAPRGTSEGFDIERRIRRAFPRQR